MVGSNWSRSQIRTTDATGRYRIPLTYGATTAGRYQYRVGVQTPAGPTYTSAATLDRIPDTSVTTAGTKPVNQTTYAWGYAAGSPNATAWTEVWVGSHWSRSQTTTTDSTGYYTIPLTYGQNTAGRYAYRVVVPTAAGGAPSLTAMLDRTATITATAASSRRIGAVANAWGTVGGVPNATVSIDVWTGTSWTRSQQRATADSTGYYVIPLEFGRWTLGTHYYRVVAETPLGQVASNAVEQRTIP